MTTVTVVVWLAQAAQFIDAHAWDVYFGSLVITLVWVARLMLWSAPYGRAAEAEVLKLGLVPFGFVVVVGVMMATSPPGSWLVLVPVAIALRSLARLLGNRPFWRLGGLSVGAIGFAASLIQIWTWPPVQTWVGQH